MENKLTEMVFILDKSSSMHGLEDETIAGYNNFLEKQKQNEGNCLITTVLFSHNYVLLHDRSDIKDVQPITTNEYFVEGYTALLDAIGKTILDIKEKQNRTQAEAKVDNVIFVIITDGEENSSREFSSAKVKEMIEQQKQKHNWEFIFLGANIDAVETAHRFGIHKDRVADFHADHIGVSLNFKMMSDTVTAFRQSGTVDEKYLDEIREDQKKRKPKGK